MMLNVQGQFETGDRWPLVITKLEPGESRAFDATTGTWYIMLQNASYYSDNVKFENVNAAFAVNNYFTIKTISSKFNYSNRS
jgi:hypothetical protein